MEDTKQRILEKSLELFSAKGYDAVSVGEIAKAVRSEEHTSELQSRETNSYAVFSLKKKKEKKIQHKK